VVFNGRDFWNHDSLPKPALLLVCQRTTATSRNAALLSSSKYIAYTQMVLLVSFAPCWCPSHPHFHSLLFLFFTINIRQCVICGKRQDHLIHSTRSCTSPRGLLTWTVVDIDLYYIHFLYWSFFCISHRGRFPTPSAYEFNVLEFENSKRTISFISSSTSFISSFHPFEPGCGRFLSTNDYHMDRVLHYHHHHAVVVVVVVVANILLEQAVDITQKT
jgi:hypothetical protein